MEKKRRSRLGTAIRASGERSAMKAVGSRSVTTVWSLSGQACMNWPNTAVTDRCPPGAKAPPSVQYA